jgi:hypothetical protein
VPLFTCLMVNKTLNFLSPASQVPIEEFPRMTRLQDSIRQQK